jgi:hypothetical protein
MILAQAHLETTAHTPTEEERQDGMMVRTLMAMIVTGGAFAVLAGQQAGNAPAAQEPPKPAAGAEEQQAMQDAEPGPIHKHMKECEGEFTTKIKFTMPGGGPPEESTGTAKIKMTLDGRFLVEESEGMMMGMPFKTLKISGYNNAAKEFESVWMYTMSTGMMRLVGTSDDQGKTVKWKASYKEADGDHNLDVITTHIDADTFVERLSEGADGPVMETTYTRKK